MGMQMAFLARHGIYLKLEIYLIQEMAFSLHRKGEGGEGDHLISGHAM